MTALTPADLDLHARLGIEADVLDRLHVRRVDDREAREVLAVNGISGRLDGVLYPYVIPGQARAVTHRLRRDHPDIEAGQPKNKYIAGYGDARHVYFATGDAALLTETAVPIVLVEAEKSALAIMCAARRTGRRVLAIALGGCWGWRGRIGKTVDASGVRVDELGASADFSLITWTHRDVVIVFDGNVAANLKVRAARTALVRELGTREARVRLANLPVEAGINGPDDYVGRHGDEAWWTLVDRAADTDGWVRDQRGQIAGSNLKNIRVALAHIGITPAYDAFARELRINGAVIDDDVAFEKLWTRISDTCGFQPSRPNLRSVVLCDAHDRARHPVLEYLDRLRWDGIARLDRWLVDYAGAEDTDYGRAVAALPLLAAVRRVRHPGAKFDELLILESPQGTGKSSALRALCPRDDWFSDDLPLGVDSKPTIERTAGKWIIEAAELYGNRGKETEALKTFLSRQWDGPVRLAYGRLSVTVPRQFVIIGTTNHSTSYLKDLTGARRFWPVRAHIFDVEGIARDRDQLWAEAAAREPDAFIRLPRALWAMAAVEQEARRAADPWEDVIEPLLGNGVSRVEQIGATELWTAIGVEANRRNNRDADRLAGIMERLGFAKMKTEGRMVWRRRPELREPSGKPSGRPDHGYF